MSTGIQFIQENWRVKLYQLDEDGAWLDQGTGYASCQNVSVRHFSILSYYLTHLFFMIYRTWVDQRF